MCQKVVEHGAHLGIAHDGDADRVLLCDEKGNLIDGDDIMAIAALEMLAEKTLAEKTLVSDRDEQRRPRSRHQKRRRQNAPHRRRRQERD